jgi:predicted MFS family arabinose efflux permease
LLACGYVDFALLAYHYQTAALVRPPAIPLLYAVAMGIDGLAALFLGKLFDRHGIIVLCSGIVVSMLALPLAFLAGPPGAIPAVACWAVGMGAQDATLRPGIARAVSMDKRGTAFGAFNAVYGIAWFAGSAAMGFLYEHSLVALVVFGVAAQLAAAAMFFVLRATPSSAASVRRS